MLGLEWVRLPFGRHARSAELLSLRRRAYNLAGVCISEQPLAIWQSSLSGRAYHLAVLQNLNLNMPLTQALGKN